MPYYILLYRITPYYTLLYLIIIPYYTLLLYLIIPYYTLLCRARVRSWLLIFNLARQGHGLCYSGGGHGRLSLRILSCRQRQLPLQEPARHDFCGNLEDHFWCCWECTSLIVSELQRIHEALSE